MAKLCAPGRDGKIRELTAMRDIVPLYKGIFEVNRKFFLHSLSLKDKDSRNFYQTLELMRIDMANFTIRMSRPHIAACSIEYERSKFEDYLKITPGMKLVFILIHNMKHYVFFCVVPDGLRHTREWLHRNRKETSQSASPTGVQMIPSILVDAFMELLCWDDSNSWPEVK